MRILELSREIELQGALAESDYQHLRLHAQRFGWERHVSTLDDALESG